MNNSMEHIAFKDTLIQSDFAGNHYEVLFNQEINTFTNPLVEDIEEIYNQIIKTYNDLTDFQIDVLTLIMDQLNELRISSDPKRLKDFYHGLTPDCDLLLYRENENGLINIIIHPEDNFAFSFIGNKEGRRLEFHKPEDADFEKIVLEFMV